MISVGIGDIVQLKSGGPPMTVTYVDDIRADCAWFDDKLHNLAHSFPLECLLIHGFEPRSDTTAS